MTTSGSPRPLRRALPSASPAGMARVITNAPTVPRTPASTFGTIPIRPINIVVLADGSWDTAPTPTKLMLDADYGHIILSCVKLRPRRQSTKGGLAAIVEYRARRHTPDYFLMNRDFLRGTLLGPDPPESLLGILERMMYDTKISARTTFRTPRRWRCCESRRDSSTGGATS